MDRGYGARGSAGGQLRRYPGGGAAGLLMIALRYRQLLRETEAWQTLSRWLAERLV
jgi:hypothetical protein